MLNQSISSAPKGALGCIWTILAGRPVLKVGVIRANPHSESEGLHKAALQIILI